MAWPNAPASDATLVGIGYLVEVAIRVLIIETTSTGIALLGSKLLP
jgi:hypothetical protein